LSVTVELIYSNWSVRIGAKLIGSMIFLDTEIHKILKLIWNVRLYMLVTIYEITWRYIQINRDLTY
jgi:hypothetical protein